jgi:hypothetical protein
VIEHLLPGKAGVVLDALERAIQPGRRDFEPRIVDVAHFQHILELARDCLAVLHRDELMIACRVGLAGNAVDGDAQQPACRSLDIDEFITQTCHRLLNGLAPAHQAAVPFSRPDSPCSRASWCSSRQKSDHAKKMGWMNPPT